MVTLEDFVNVPLLTTKAVQDPAILAASDAVLQHIQEQYTLRSPGVRLSQDYILMQLFSRKIVGC